MNSIYDMKLLNSKSVQFGLILICFSWFTSGCSQTERNQNAATGNDQSNVLIVGGGEHHDFDQWFHYADSTTISESGAVVNYTDRPQSILPALPQLDVLYLSNNQPLPDPELRQGVFDFVESGNGLLLVHAATWYSWEDWPEFNRELVSGGSRSHGPYGEFEVRVVDEGHPLMESVPASFRISDELYRFENDPEGPEITVLAVGIEPDTGTEYPVVWIVNHHEGRIVCMTLGHDGESHNHPAYQAILTNSVEWLTAD